MKNLLVILMMIFGSLCLAQTGKHIESSLDFNLNQLNESLRSFWKKENADGLAFAIFKKDAIIWQQCLGNSTYGQPIDDKTLFSIQSISKNITALAAMIAVQDRLLELDRPISDYLPDFTVNSCFEEFSEKKITMRMLLSHTAGFTHEAPAGNNYDYNPCSFKDHYTSIRNTWLRFPAGTNWAYSNLGFDLAAGIIERQAGISFTDYLQTRIFNPLGMSGTTIDDNRFTSNSNITEGRIPSIKTKHYQIPLQGSGAVYTNLGDFVKYIQFMMNKGKTAGIQGMEEKYLKEMYTIRLNNYGLGTYIDKTDGMYYLNHNGSGYGYSATFLWYPEYNIAAVILCNKQCNTFNFCENLLNKYINDSELPKDSSVSKAFDLINAQYFKDANKINDIKTRYCTDDTLFETGWEGYTGKYSLLIDGLDLKWDARIATAMGFHPQKITIQKEGSTLRIRSALGESILREYRPGLFFTNGGEVVDFNTQIPTYKNIKLKKLY